MPPTPKKNMLNFCGSMWLCRLTKHDFFSHKFKRLDKIQLQIHAVYIGLHV